MPARPIRPDRRRVVIVGAGVVQLDPAAVQRRPTSPAFRY